MNKVLEALQFRHACKQFDPKHKIPEEKLSVILECGRLSPSAFGLEPWKIVVLQDDDLRSNLRKVCWNQPQITDSSVTLVIMTSPDKLKPGSEYVREKFARKKPSDDALKASLERYAKHMESEVEPVMSYYSWASKQCYIALANMMTAAASDGIDSCPIEGFSKNEVEDVLGLKGSSSEVVVLLALGYRKGEQSERLRVNFNEIMDYR